LLVFSGIYIPVILMETKDLEIKLNALIDSINSQIAEFEKENKLNIYFTAKNESGRNIKPTLKGLYTNVDLFTDLM
jgi:hypothetical protein